LQAVNNQLDQSEKNDNSGQADHPPIGRRLIIALCLFIGGFLLSLRGWEHTNNDRRLISTAQIVCGLGLSGRGVLLWLVTERRLSRCRNAGTSRHWANDAPASNPCKYCHWGNSFSNSESVICFVSVLAMNRILAGEQQRHSIGIVTQSGLMLGTAIPLAHLAHRAVATLGTSGLSEKNSRVPMPAEAAIVSPELAFKVLPLII